MADKKISGMSNAAVLTGVELIPMVQGGANVAGTPVQIKTYIGAEPAWNETTVNLASAGWLASAQSETVTGLTGSSEVMVFPPSDRTAFLAYGAAQISATSISANTITFTCTTDPVIDIDNVIVRWR